MFRPLRRRRPIIDRFLEPSGADTFRQCARCEHRHGDRRICRICQRNKGLVPQFEQLAQSEGPKSLRIKPLETYGPREEKVPEEKCEVATPATRELVDKFREGLAKRFGVPKECIREDVAERWARGFIRGVTTLKQRDMVAAGEEFAQSVIDTVREISPMSRRYAKGLAEIADVPEKEIMKSRAFRRFSRRVI